MLDTWGRCSVARGVWVWSSRRDLIVRRLDRGFGRRRNVGAGMGLRGTIMDVGHAGGPILAVCARGVYQLYWSIHHYWGDPVYCGAGVLDVDPSTSIVRTASS